MDPIYIGMLARIMSAADAYISQSADKCDDPEEQAFHASVREALDYFENRQ